MAVQVTHVSTEAAASEPSSTVRISQYYTDVAFSRDSSANIAQYYVEVLASMEDAPPPAPANQLLPYIIIFG